MGIYKTKQCIIILYILCLFFEQLSKKEMLRLNSIARHSANLFKRYCYPFSTAKRDYYEVLGVAKNAKQYQIKRAYYKLAQQYHPDKNKTDEAHLKFTELNNANQVLSNPEKRRRYDNNTYDESMQSSSQNHTSSWSPYSNQYQQQVTFEEVLNFAGGFFSSIIQSNMENAKRGIFQYSNKELQITWFESISGCKKAFLHQKHIFCPCCNGDKYFTTDKTEWCEQCNSKGFFGERRKFWDLSNFCQKCSGTGCQHIIICRQCGGRGYKWQSVQQEIEIHQNQSCWQGLLLFNKGDFDSPLYVHIDIHSKSMYHESQNGYDMKMDLQILFLDAIKGVTLHIYDPDKQKLTLEIPPGTKQNDKITVKSRGLTYTHINQQTKQKEQIRGDIIFTIKIFTAEVESETQQDTPELRDKYQKLFNLRIPFTTQMEKRKKNNNGYTY